MGHRGPVPGGRSPVATAWSTGAVDLTLRPLRRDDFGRVATWLAEPHVAEWWTEPAPTVTAVAAQYGPCVDGDDPTEVFIVELEGEPVGLIQRYRCDDPDWARVLAELGAEPAAGFDYLIGPPEVTGRGVGTTVLGRLLAATWVDLPDHDHVAVLVQQANRRSWRALERAGFGRTWAGSVHTGDPDDDGPSYLYVADRPAR